MIPRTLDLIEASDWQTLLAQAIRTPQALAEALTLPDTWLQGMIDAHGDFPVRVPQPFLQCMRRGDPDDPLLLQVLPQAQELTPSAGYSDDPLAEAAANPQPGLVHKYRGRVLLTLTGACAVHCRYCFRRHFPYADNRIGERQWQNILMYLRDDPGIHEVILSGGDPLIISNEVLARRVADLAHIDHLNTLRIHSRLPVVLPQRLDAGLVEALTGSRLQAVLVIHSNHPNELSEQVATRLTEAGGAGITLLNQTVLLKGVNDDADVLSRLSERLFACRVMPYYLHLLDQVNGASHFHVSDTEAQRLWQAMHQRLPGYLLPRLVRETAGEPGKTWVIRA